MVEEKPKEDGQEERKPGIDEERMEPVTSTAEGVSRSDSALEDAAVGHIKGWRLFVLTIALCMGLFLAALDTTIISTSLVTITKSLKAWNRSSWIVTSYLLTYTGFMILWAKLSDIFGRRLFLLIAILIVVVFSAACGAAQTDLQLIIFRAFQGIGGSGIYSMGLVIIPEMVPPKKYAMYNSLVSSVIGFSFLLGPLIGGAIDNHTTWRWIFWINVPIGLAALFAIWTTMPATFPHSTDHSVNSQSLSMRKFRRIDFPGSFLLLGGSILLVCALEEAGTRYAWSSAVVITLLVVSVVLWTSFLMWQNAISRREAIREPVFPWRFVENRIVMGMFLLTMLAGTPFTTIIIELPQRFQAVNNASPLGGGIRLLPFTLSWPFGSALTGPLTSSLRVPPIYVIFLGAVLQTVGLALSYNLPVGLKVPAAQYGFEAMIGFGCGLTLTTSVLITPSVVGKRDLAVAMGALTQCRVLGGAIGIGMATNLVNNRLKSSLSSILSEAQLNSLFIQPTEAIRGLQPALQDQVRMAFATGYNLQTRALLGFSAAEFLAIALMWERRPRTIASS